MFIISDKEAWGQCGMVKMLNGFFGKVANILCALFWWFWAFFFWWIVDCVLLERVGARVRAQGCSFGVAIHDFSWYFSTF